MATVAAQQVTSAGLAATANVASVGGDKVPPGTTVVVFNGSASSVTVTMATPQSIDGDLAVADRTVAVPASAHRYIAATRLYRNPSDGLVALQWSATDPALTFEVIR